ncbi:putative aldehyde dehydrogenase [Lyophyllum shimeji]|uniref:Aldehyde dehydrogenase n=1 Tax=Lyophyllum shimeji TaxID=47721 RepID=A0A9P3UWX9_LYOSH|nr:putative aldehyde dehydrogenase [Lyophyllum shimeji]
MPSVFSHEWDTPAFKGKTSFSTGLYINGQFVDGSSKSEIEVLNPKNDVDIAVGAAQKAFDTVWGLNVSGAQRGELLNKLAALMEEHKSELAALEALDNGKTFGWAHGTDVTFGISVVKYYAGWADKIHGQTIETDEKKLTYTRHEPIGVVVSTITSLYSLLDNPHPMSTGANSAMELPSPPAHMEDRACTRRREHHRPQVLGTHPPHRDPHGPPHPRSRLPPGVVNILTGYGNTVGQAISTHMRIDKVAFTGSTLVGRKVMEAAAKSNLKQVTLELGGKSPNIIFNDADLEQAVNWSAHGIFWNHGQACCAGSRIFVQAGIYDEFLKRFTARAQAIKLGDPFNPETNQGPQVSQIQYDRIMNYIESGKQAGAKVHLGGDRFGTEGYFINPTIFTDTTPDMKIVQEEIFGPVGVVIKSEDEEDVLRQANDTMYGLAAAVFSQNLNRALQTAHKLKAGTAWVNCVNHVHPNVPFGGYKQSGIGRELGEYALHQYVFLLFYFSSLFLEARNPPAQIGLPSEEKLLLAPIVLVHLFPLLDKVLLLPLEMLDPLGLFNPPLMLFVLPTLNLAYVALLFEGPAPTDLITSD